MKIAGLCMIAALLLAGCATTGQVDQMIDAKMTPEIQQINTQLSAQAVAVTQTAADMKSFIKRLGQAVIREQSAIRSDIAEVQGQIAAVEKDLKATRPDIAAIESTVADLDTALESLTGKVGELKLEVVAAKEEAAAAKVLAEAVAEAAARSISAK